MIGSISGAVAADSWGRSREERSGAGQRIVGVRECEQAAEHSVVEEVEEE